MGEQRMQQSSSSSSSYSSASLLNFNDNIIDYENLLLKPIRDQYPSLQEKMTKRFYDENLFFSKQMLLGRFQYNNDKNENDNRVSHRRRRRHEKRDDDKEVKQKRQYDYAYNKVHNELMPAYQQCLQKHLQLIQLAAKNNDNYKHNNKQEQKRDNDDDDNDGNDMKSFMLHRQKEYDNYSAKRDPAHAMFTKQFGKEFADDYVYDVLFSLSDNRYE